MTPVGASSAEIRRAGHVLMTGGLVAFPTETVYGLGADASNPQAIKRIYDAKGRPSDHPVIVHVDQAQALSAWCRDIPAQAWVLAKAFWPGPLTLILKRAVDVDASVSGGQDTIGIRCPSHPVAHELLTVFAELKANLGQQRAGVAAPSANQFGRVSPTRSNHVRSEFTELVAAGMPVLEGGDSEVGIESTIIDLSSIDEGGEPALLRPGAISLEQLQTILGQPVHLGSKISPRVSGSLKAHYAPDTHLRLCASASLEEQLRAALASDGSDVAVICYRDLNIADPRIKVLRLPDNAAGYGRELYAALRRVDDLRVRQVLCEQVPTGSAWAGVRDRLSRAAAAFDSSSRASS